MKRTKTKVVPHRRKRSGKTDYRLRLRLLKSRKPRFVVRKSLNNITCQVIDYESGGDRVLVSSHSAELGKFGWYVHKGNLPAAYLTGLLCGKKAVEKKIKEVVPDMGLYTTGRGNRLFSALKGAIDSGLIIPYSEGIFPKQERLSGKHIAGYAEKLKKENPNQYKKVFSGYLKNKLKPEDVTKIFEQAKKKILGGKQKPEKKKA